jgi:cytoskeletal protein RodZ
MMLWGILVALGVLLVLWTVYQVTKEAKLLWPLLLGSLFAVAGYLGSNQFLGAALEPWVWWVAAIVGVILLVWTLYQMSRQLKLLLPLLAGLILGVVGLGGTQNWFGVAAPVQVSNASTPPVAADNTASNTADTAGVSTTATPDSGTVADPATAVQNDTANTAGKVVASATETAQGAASAVTGAVNDAAATTSKTATDAANAVGDAANTAASSATSVVESATNSVAGTVQEAAKTTTDAANGVANATGTAAAQMTDAAKATGASIACPCALKISSNVAGAKVTLSKDGKNINGAETPILIANLETGEYAVTVEAAGYTTFMGTVNTGKQTELNVVLNKP